MEIVDLRAHPASELTGDGEVLIASSLSHLALAPQSENTLEVRKGPSTIYRPPETDGDEGEEEEAAARLVVGHNEPIFQLETPKQRSAVLPPSNLPAQRSTGLAFLADSSLQPGVNEHNRTAAPRNAAFPTQAVAKPTAETSRGFDMSYRAPEPERHTQQADYLRILQDRFGTPGSDRGHRYLDTDEASARNVDDSNSLENFVDADNEGYSGRHSLKSVSHSLLSMFPTQASD